MSSMKYQQPKPIFLPGAKEPKEHKENLYKDLQKVREVFGKNFAVTLIVKEDKVIIRDVAT